MTTTVNRLEWMDPFESSTGESIRAWRTVSGGDIGRSFRIELASGGRVFLKHYADSPHGLARSEARGLRWLTEARAIRVASVLDVGEDWIALEWIESRPAAPDYAERLGQGLAALHASGAPHFGFSEPNWIGRLPQTNDPHDRWPAFYAACRIEPLRLRAGRAGLLSEELGTRLALLVEALPELVGPEEPPSRLHGDLWSGNVLPDETGAPCLIDPAVYGGHREVDLAMMQLFGGFDRSVLTAYEQAFPLDAEANARRALYQVYPLLVHVCLFGRSYLDRLANAVDAAFR